MRFNEPVPITRIAALTGAKLIGNKNGFATGINEIHKVKEGDIVFADHPKYIQAAIQSKASFIIVNEEADFPGEKALLIADHPFDAYCAIVQHYHPFEPSMEMTSGNAVVGAGTVIMPNVYIGNHVTIGSDCIIYPNVTLLDNCHLGDRVIIQSGTVIGSDAFYYNKKTNREIHFRKMPSCGRVLIGNEVEIGANCTIDRGVSSDTVIGEGTKIDNLVHIGHDSIIGKNCLFAGQVGIAGAVTIEDNVTLWGQVGVSKTLTIKKDSVVYAQSGVKDSLEAGKTWFGSPVEEAREKMKELVWIKRIPQLWKKVMEP